jgi:phosphate transport system protein
MSKLFEQEMLNIERQLMLLFGVVEKMIDDAVRSLSEQRSDLADEVIRSDQGVDQTEVAIEEDCLKVLALHQPVAVNLRRITTVLKINVDLERIADLACNIAERAQSLQQFPYFPIPEQLPNMVRQATDMVRLALDSFVEIDAKKAVDVIGRDAAVDELNRIVIDELKHLMNSDSGLIEPALHCFSVARHVERIADHAENIAEDVVYLVDGSIVRHKHGQFKTRAPNP